MVCGQNHAPISQTLANSMKYMGFKDYKANFPYKGQSIYNAVFDLHCQNIKTKKKKFAVNNLEKIIKATFRISSKIGFHEMSVRDLCRETGLSMGGIYSCIGSKEMIAIMIKDLVKLVSSEIVNNALQQDDKRRAVDDLITHSIFATEILQPWYYFLYFETRSLPKAEQVSSKQIELLNVRVLEQLLTQAHKNASKNHHPDDHYRFIATMALAMIQERYLKPWKYKDPDMSIEDYASETIKLVYLALGD